MPRVAWTKPRFLYWRDLKAFKSEDVAALMIQNQWHAYKARQFMMNAVRAQYTVKTDPLTGRLMYTNVHTHKRGFKKPPLLGSEELDPEDMSLWGIYRLGVFFRRLGYGFIAPELRRFDVDGALLLSFEWQDYVDLGFTQSHVIKRVLLQIEKRAFFKSHRDLPVTLVRRDRLRYHHRVEKAAISIQRRYRVIYAALQRARAAERERVEKAKKKAEKDRKEGGLWWSGKIKNLPVPDHGKVYGNRTVETVHGWGSWIGERWVPLDDKTRPHKQRYEQDKSEQTRLVRMQAQQEAYIATVKAEVREKYGFIYSTFEPQYYYWESIECIRRLALTGACERVLPSTERSLTVVCDLRQACSSWSRCTSTSNLSTWIRRRS